MPFFPDEKYSEDSGITRGANQPAHSQHRLLSNFLAYPPLKSLANSPSSSSLNLLMKSSDLSPSGVQVKSGSRLH